MKKSQRLKLSDVREVFRILGNARDLRHDQGQQETLIVDAMTDLLGASFGYAFQLEGFRPEGATRLRRIVPGTHQDSRIVRYLSDWGKTSDFSDDPLMHATWDKVGPAHTTSMSGVMTYEQLRSYRIYDEMVEPSGMKDVLITFFRYPGSNATRIYTFQRTLTQKEYEPRQLRVAHLFITELYRLYCEEDLEPRGPLYALPPRLARLAHQLATGQSQRQIARSQNLSYQTVRSYTKELYDTVRVSSREELVAKIFNRGD